MSPILVIGVDPDKDTPAFASVLIGADYSLRLAAVALGDESIKLPETVTRSERFVGGFSSPASSDLWPCATRVFIESPEAVYTKGKGIRVQDIVELARRAGEMAALLTEYASGIQYISPAEWKAQVPKDICQARICSRLGWPFEKMSGYSRPTTGFQDVAGAKGLKKSDWKHVMDAIGIALWGADTIISIEKRRQAIERASLPAR